MQSEQKNQEKQEKRPPRQLVKYVVAAIVLIIVVLVAMLPVIVSSGFATKRIVSAIDESTGGSSKIGAFSMGWFSGVRVEDFSYEGKEGISVRVNRITTKPPYLSLIAGNMSFGRTVVDEPYVKLPSELRAVKGKPGDDQEGAEKAPSEFKFPVRKMALELNGGEVEIAGAGGRRFALHDMQTELDIQPAGRQSSFNLKANVGDGSKRSSVSAKGRIQPNGSGSKWSLEGAKGQFTVEVNEVDLSSIEPLMQVAGIEVETAGEITGKMDTEIDGGRLSSVVADVSGKEVLLGGKLLRGDVIKTGDLQVEASFSQNEDMVNIEKLNVKTDWLNAQADGAVPMGYGSFRQFVSGTSQPGLRADFEMDVAGFAGQATGLLGLEGTAKIDSGRLSGHIEKTVAEGRGKLLANAELSDLGGTVRGDKIALSAPVIVEARISATEQGVAVEKANVESSFASLDCSGDLESLGYNANGDLAKFQGELGQFLGLGEQEMAGSITASGNVSMGQRIGVKGNARAENLNIRVDPNTSISQKQLSADYDVAVDPAESLVQVNSAKIQSDAGTVSIRDGQVPTAEVKGAKLNLPVSMDIALGRIQPYIVKFAPRFDKVEMKGQLRGDIDVSRSGSAWKLFTDNSRVSDLRVAGPNRSGLEEDQLDISGDALVDPADGSYDIEWDIRGEKLKSSGKIHKGRQEQSQNIQGEGTIEYEWPAGRALAGGYWPEDLLVDGYCSDIFEFSMS